MKKFYYILQDNPHHPDSLMATSKEEVKNILMESLADESAILGIFTEAEFNKKFNLAPNDPQNAAYADPNDFKDGNDFMNSMIAAANKIPNQEEQMEDISQQNIQPSPPPVMNEVKYFELNGEKLKLENGSIYKKNWRVLTEEESESYRIVSSKTKKEVKSDQYQIEKLDWEKIS